MKSKQQIEDAYNVFVETCELVEATMRFNPSAEGRVMLGELHETAMRHVVLASWVLERGRTEEAAIDIILSVSRVQNAKMRAIIEAEENK